MRPDEIAELLPYLTDEERVEVETILTADQKSTIWRPLPGPQAEAFHCQADVTGYGGAGGGGKTDLLCGLITTVHKRAVIFRREKAQTERIVQRLTEMLGTTMGLNSQKGIWKLPEGRLLELAGLDNEGDEMRWQGRDHDLKAYDEVTEMREAQVRFTMGWKRSADPKVRSRVVMTFNPPQTAEGQWVIKYFGPWLQENHPNPARPGELRWFTTIGDDNDVEVPDCRPFIIEGGERVYDFNPKRYRKEDIIEPESRTFIPSRVSDNPYYMATGYVKTLQVLPEPLRSKLLHGDFKAGMEDDPWQVIPTAWVDAAQKRWTAKNPKGPMDSMGVDVARGGRDKTIISRRHGPWYDLLLPMPGTAEPDGPTTASYVIAARRDKSPVHIDIVGWGAAPYDFLVENQVQTVGVNGQNATEERTDDEASLGFYNTRALLWWRMREALDPDAKIQIALPPDPELKSDLCAPRWKVRSGTILIEDKGEIRKRIGRSPDRGDAVVMARIDTLKRDAGKRRVSLPKLGAV